MIGVSDIFLLDFITIPYITASKSIFNNSTSKNLSPKFFFHVLQVSEKCRLTWGMGVSVDRGGSQDRGGLIIIGGYHTPLRTIIHERGLRIVYEATHHHLRTF